MAIDYKKEVDSGKDRKLMVEHVIFELAKRGIPTEEIQNDPNFIKFRHSELLRNISRGYASKLEQFEELYGGFYEEPQDGLGEDYSKLFHEMKELYPMTPQEEKALFTKRIKLLKEIKDDQKSYEKKLTKDRDKIINKIAKFKVKYPVIDKILDLTFEMDELQEQGKLNGQTMEALFKKYGIDQKKFSVVDSIYREYMELMTEFDLVNDKIINVQKGLLHSPEYSAKKIEEEKITEEIISRNIKLINYFIRSQYGNLLVDQGELFSICLEGLYNSLKEFDPSKGKFSTFAFTGMNYKLHQEFKNLTGYKWEEYWQKQKINKLIEIVSEMLGRTATVIDLVELGLIDLSYEKALQIQKLPVFLLESYVYGEPGPDEQLADPEFDPSLLQDEWEDNRYANLVSEADEYTNISEKGVLENEMADILFGLTDRERMVLVLRYGLDPYKYLYDYERQYFVVDAMFVPWTLDDVAKQFHLTRERIRQIEAKALRKLRHPHRTRRVEDFLPKV